MLRHAAGGIALLRLQQHVAADRRSHGRAAAAGLAAMLDDDGADIARRAHRRERDEQRMVASLPGDVLELQLALALRLGHVEDLRSAGLAAHLHAGLGDARRKGRAALFIYHRVHAVEHQPEIPRRYPDRREIGALAAAVAAHDAGGARQPRHDGARSDEARRHDRKLQRRRRDIALADAGADRLAQLPGNALGAELPLRRRNEPGALVGHVDAERRAQPHARSHRGHAIDPRPSAGLVEVHVAGMLNGVAQRYRAVTALLPTMELDVTEREVAGACEGRLRRDDAGLERRQRHHRLEGGAGRVGAADGLVAERRALVVLDALPRRLAHARDEPARVIARARNHGQHLAGPRIHQDAGRALLGGAAPRGKLLQRHVDAEDRLLTGNALLTRQLAHDAPEGIHLDLAGAGAAAQVEVVRLLDAFLADAEVGQLEQRIVARQFLFRDRGNIAQDVRGLLAERIVADEALLDRHARQLQRVDLDARHLFPAQIFADHDGHEAVLAANVAQHPATIRFAQRDQRTDSLERRLDIAGLLGHEHDAVGRAVVGENGAEAVDDAAARRRHQTDVDAVLIRQHRIAVG